MYVKCWGSLGKEGHGFWLARSNKGDLSGDQRERESTCLSGCKGLLVQLDRVMSTRKAVFLSLTASLVLHKYLQASSVWMLGHLSFRERTNVESSGCLVGHG